MSISSKDRKSILWHYGKHTVEEMAGWSRFRYLSVEQIQKIIDDEYAEPEPTRADDPKTSLADKLFPGFDEWERDHMLEKLCDYIRGES